MTLSEVDAGIGGQKSIRKVRLFEGCVCESKFDSINHFSQIHYNLSQKDDFWSNLPLNSLNSEELAETFVKFSLNFL